MRVFITGSAGFIGFHLAHRMLRDGHTVRGYDGITPYYDVNLKKSRHEILQALPEFDAVIGMLEDKTLLESSIAEFSPDVIVHLAAQAGVRYGLEDPESYISSNLVGTFNVLEAAKQAKPRHLLIASSSSVYGGNDKMPFAETDPAHAPVSLYAATKKASESLSHAYAHLWQLPTTCFRFFTVYGPWGRPDMALFKFVDAIEDGLPIDVYDEGNMRRDFTYVDDLVEALVRLIAVMPEAGRATSPRDSLSKVAPWRVVNIGGGNPVGLLAFIETIERKLGKPAIKNFLPRQPGDVTETYADVSLLRELIGYVPETPVEIGVGAFVDWYRNRR
ncbi:MAG: UDP-glucuronate 5-epimerase [Hyphomicrobiales bacterium]|nr:UDP-glucuronate 5-epimerase [Hyphomicrobiales bacterium]